MVFSLLLIFCSASFSQELGLKSITGKVGIVMPESPWNTGFLIGGEANLGEIFQGTTLNPFLAYWSSGYSILGIDLSLSNFQLGADLHYSIPDVKGLFVGGGLGLNFISFEAPNIFGAGSFSTSDTKIGIDLLAGYKFPISTMTGVAGARYNIISDFNTFEITLGLEFDMTK